MNLSYSSSSSYVLPSIMRLFVVLFVVTMSLSESWARIVISLGLEHIIHEFVYDSLIGD